MTTMTADESSLLELVERVLHERIGLDVTTVGRSLVSRAVHRRIGASGARSVAEYVSRLGVDEQELQELVEVVVVPETYFFREPEALNALAQLITGGALRPSVDTPLRILSAPCSTGEEPYSIAMTLLAAGVPASTMTIDAVDVSHDAVRRARRAVYRTPSFRGTSFDWTPYFTQTAGGERALDDAVRALVQVEQANLLDPSFRAPRSAYDVVFCRNLLIYFDTDTQSRVLATLTGLLAPDGILVVGAADTFAVRRAGFVPIVGAERAFLFRYRGTTDDPTPAVPARMPDVAIRARRRPALPSRAGAPVRRKPAAAPVQLEPSAPPENVIGAVTRLANEGRLAEAVRVGEAALDGDDASADLLALLGTTYAALHEQARAESYYRRALYLHPSHPEALLHLALLLERRGDGEGALRLRMRAKRDLADSPGERR